MRIQVVRPSVTVEDVSRWDIFINLPVNTQEASRRRGGRKSRRMLRSVVSGHRMAVAFKLTVVVTCVRPAEDQASPNSRVDGEELMKSHP